jgi:dUTP pyrophosphatase
MSNPVIDVKFKKTHSLAQLPSKKNPSDTGYDIYAAVDVVIPAKGSAFVPTGITVADITPGYWFLVLPRSGLGFKHGLQPHLGTIDNPYRGDLGIKMYNFSDKDYLVQTGDRIAQFAFFPLVHANTSWSEEVTATERGANGFGSTGR